MIWIAKDLEIELFNRERLLLQSKKIKANDRFGWTLAGQPCWKLRQSLTNIQECKEVVSSLAFFISPFFFAPLPSSPSASEGNLGHVRTFLHYQQPCPNQAQYFSQASSWQCCRIPSFKIFYLRELGVGDQFKHMQLWIAKVRLTWASFLFWYVKSFWLGIDNQF